MSVQTGGDASKQNSHHCGGTRLRKEGVRKKKQSVGVDWNPSAKEACHEDIVHFRPHDEN